MSNIDLLDELRLLDEIALVELLGLTSNDIVDAFTDFIDERQNFLRHYIDENK